MMQTQVVHEDDHLPEGILLTQLHNEVRELPLVYALLVRHYEVKALLL